MKEVALEDMKNLSPASLAAAPSSTGVTQLDGVKVCICICVYMYMCICVYVYICMGVAQLDGVKVTSIRKGDGRTFPQAGDVLTMHYVGKLRANKQVRGVWGVWVRGRA